MIVAYKAQIENSEEASHTEEVWVDTGEVDEEGNPVYEIEEVTVTDELGGWVEEQITDFSVENLAAYEQDGFTAVAVDDEGVETDVQWTEVEEPADPYEQVELDIAGIAAAGNQRFWHNSDGASEYGGTGAHVTDTEKDEWVDAVADGFSDLSDEKPYHNLLMNSLGILLRRALNTLVSISKTAIAFFDGEGNQASNIVASFGRDGARIGKRSGMNMLLAPTYLNLRDSNDIARFGVAYTGPLGWMSFSTNLGQVPDADGELLARIEPGGTATFAFGGTFDLATHPFSIALGGRSGTLTFTGDGSKSASGITATVETGSDGLTLALTNTLDTAYTISSSASNATVAAGYVQVRGCVVSVDGRAGVTQTVTIGDKTLTITGGIITGIS